MADVSGVTKHFPTHKEGFVTTLSSSISAGATTIPLTTVSGLTNGDVFVGIVEPGEATEQVFTGTVDTSGVQITNVVWTKGTNADHAAGSAVVDWVTSTSQNMQTKGILVQHNQDGTHGAITSTSATLTTPKVITSINDTNDNELIKVTATASAVNEVTVTNAATGNAPSISATGGDTNIDLELAAKGTGDINITTGELKKAGNPIDWWEEIGRTTLGSAGDTISVTPITAKKYLKIIVNALATGGTINTVIRFNNDSGSNYARRISDEGTADAIGVSQTGLTIGTTGAWNQLAIVDVTNIAASEKLAIGQQTGVSTSGAGSAPRRQELTGKWANTSDQITRVDVINLVGTGDYAIGSEVIVLGHD